MTEVQKKQIELTITRLETKLDTYNRAKERTKKQAIMDEEYGYHESAKFNKGQAFALDYVIEDLQIILQGLKNVKKENEEWKPT